jgi:hypothetical protein
MSVYTLSWTMLEEEIALFLQVKRKHVTKLRRSFFDDGDVTSLPKHNNNQQSNRGAGSPDYPTAMKLDCDQLQELIKEVDSRHAGGKTVTNQLMRNFIRMTFQIDLSKSTMSSYFSNLGLEWKAIRSRKKNVGAYRMDLLRDFIVELDKNYKIWKDDPASCPFVFVFTDETYIHKTHAQSKSYLSKTSQVNRSSSKGQRLVILHAISPHGPLCERVDGVPIDDLSWTGDTPHPKPRNDGMLTCELIWKASSQSGDYHDNMNSDMFMKWTEEKLIPTFERLHPQKKMLLICDNAPYHHKRDLGSLANKSKQQLIDLASLHQLKYLDIPLTERRCRILDEGKMEHVEERGNLCRVPFDAELMSGRSRMSKPFTP